MEQDQLQGRLESMVSYRPRLVPVVLLAAVCAVTAFLFLAHSGSARSVAHPTTKAPGSQKAAQPSPAAVNALSQFGVFSHAAGPADVPPSQAGYAGGISRRIASTTGSVDAWAVLTGDQLCITVNASSGPAQGGGAACASAQALAAVGQRQFMVLGAGAGPSGSPPQADQLVVGLVPDGVSAVTVAFTDGSSTTASVINNGFELNTNGRMPSTYTWSSSDGATHTEPAA